jgi:hypothetical protein
VLDAAVARERAPGREGLDFAERGDSVTGRRALTRHRQLLLSPIERSARRRVSDVIAVRDAPIISASVPGPDDRDAVRSMLEPDAGPSRQLIGDLIHETGNITHAAIVCRRCGPAIVNLAGVIGIDFPADHGSRVFDWVSSNADPPGVAHRVRGWPGRLL